MSGFNDQNLPLRMLIVAHLDRLAARLDRSQYYRYAALAAQPGVTLLGPGLEGYRQGMSVADAVEVACGGVFPDVIFHGMDFKESGVPLLSGLSECPVTTILELQDSWANSDCQIDFINRQAFNIVLLIVSHHIPFYRQHCPNTEFLWTPHAINTALFHDYGLAKETDVLLYGNVAAHTYPLRARLAEILSGSDLKFRWLQHPGYYPKQDDTLSQVVTGADLSREINRSWITISTSSIYQCVMMKYYEIAASRSLIAGDMPAEGRLIFGDNFLELRSEQSDAEILTAFRQCLADKATLRHKTDAAHSWIIREHNLNSFAARLLSQLPQILERCQTVKMSAIPQILP